MSPHSPSESAAGVRLPKLKCRNGAPECTNRLGLPSPSTHPSTATRRPDFSGADTAATSILHPPPPSVSQMSPVSPVSPTRASKVPVRDRPGAEEALPGGFGFPVPATVPPGSLDEEAGGGGAIWPIPSSADAAPSRPHFHDTDDVGSALPALTRRNLASRDSHAGHGLPHRPAKKKGRASGVFGFFAVKEPSALALEQFAESQRRQADMKGGRSTTAGLPGITDRKLPAEVPKVNSKWDGLPAWAREAAKEAKKDDKTGSDAGLDKMADYRRPNSQHTSVSTFGSSGSGRGQANPTSPTVKQSNSKTVQRPASSRTNSASSSGRRLRNPSRGRGGVPSKSSNPFQQNDQPHPKQEPALTSTPDMSALPGITSYFPDFTATGTPPHAHKRTASDPRLNYGMDNVAAITAFLGDEDVSVPRILPRRPQASSKHTIPAANHAFEEPPPPPPPPIPRKSSRRQSSQPNIRSAAFCSARDSICPDTIEPVLPSEQAPSLGAFPSPPDSPIKGGGKGLRSDGGRDGSTIPALDTQVRAIFPPDTIMSAAAVLPGSQIKQASARASSPRHRMVQHKSSLGRISPFPLPSSTRPRASMPTAGVQHPRGSSGAPAPAPGKPGEQKPKTPEARLKSADPSPVNRSETVPWPSAADPMAGKPTATASAPSKRNAAGTASGGKTRWGSLGKKAPK